MFKNFWGPAPQVEVSTASRLVRSQRADFMEPSDLTMRLLHDLPWVLRISEGLRLTFGRS